jgi:hypothetical protein
VTFWREPLSLASNSDARKKYPKSIEIIPFAESKAWYLVWKNLVLGEFLGDVLVF